MDEHAVMTAREVPGSTSPLLAIRGLCVGFRRRDSLVRAVDGVDLTLAPGESLGIVGESGCGKSALALAIMGLLPEAGRILGGTIALAGEELTSSSRRRYRQLRGGRMAMIFQDPMTSLNPYMTIADQLMEPLRIHRALAGRAARDRCVELLAEVGIDDPGMHLRRRPHQLSGGQRQRVMIAMALACDPELLIADEPTTALDVTIQAQVLRLLRNQQRQRRMGLILITHNLGVVAGMCDRVAVMYAGRLVEIQEVRNLFKTPRHPYTRGLLQAMPRIDDDPTTPLVAIPGAPPDLARPRRGCDFAQRCFHAVDRCRSALPELRRPQDGVQVRCLFEPAELMGPPVPDPIPGRVP